MIKIETEKIIVRGEQKRKLTGYELLGKDNLPTSYSKALADGARCWLHDDGALAVSAAGREVDWYRAGRYFDEPHFQQILRVIKSAGNCLQKINARLAEENKDWHGEETFLI